MFFNLLAYKLAFKIVLLLQHAIFHEYQHFKINHHFTTLKVRTKF